MIEKHPLEPTYQNDNGLWLLNVDSPDIPGGLTIVERNIVCIPGGEFGGNHKHPRVEAFAGIGRDLELIWQDDDGVKHTERMDDGRSLQLFVIHSLTPHVVVNRGDSPAVLIEFANDKQHNVEAVDLLGS